VLCGLFVLAVTPIHAGLVISAGFDTSITGDANAAAIMGVINSAINVYQSTFSNNITVKIYFQEGGGLGQSNFFNNNPTYTSFYNGLVANNSNAGAIAGLNANGGNAGTNGGVNPVNGSTTLTMKSANERAVGINQGPQCVPTATGNGTLNGNVPNTCTSGSGAGAYDGIISLNTLLTFPPQGVPGNYGLLAVTEHEIDEILGLGSALRNCDPTNNNSSAACKAAGPWNLTVAGASSFSQPTPEDLYRWNAATGGSRTVGTNCGTPTSAYFSYGPSTGQIAQFNNTCNGSDFGDWTGSASPQVQDANGTPGTNPTLGASEIAALSAIGYTLSAPEPGTLLLLSAGLALVIGRKRRA
jgi:hypothetical protein